MLCVVNLKVNLPIFYKSVHVLNSTASKIKMLDGLVDISVRYNAPLKEYTYTKTGGNADILAFPKSEEEIIKLVNLCTRRKLTWLVIGSGSNLLVSDEGFRGMVIVLTEMNKIIIQGELIIADAGAKLIDTSYEALENHLTGLEFTCGIPGTIGGAVFMNAGAYDGEIKDVLISATVMFPDSTTKFLTNKEIKFSYRCSAIEQINCIILQATFALNKGNKHIIKKKMNELTKLREAKQPLEYPSCGSVFKRPHGYFAGKLIQDAGLQGLKWGGAQVSEKHAGFIINVNQASTTDYVELISYIQKTVKDKFGVMLEKEVRIIGK